MPGTNSSLLTILELSDIHFIEDVDVDTNAELSDAVLEFAAKIRARFGEIDVIVVCGDIAYSGREEEYARASTFLRNLEVALGGPRILVIPGNHDIYRRATENAEQSVLRGRPRQKTLSDGDRDKELADILSDAQKGTELLEPLRAYMNFAAQFDCAVDAAKPYWEIRVPINERLEACFRGLNSVLVSDANDVRYHLLLSRMQTASIRRNTAGVLNITLCHHPFECLLDGEEQRDTLDHRCALHISGHVHRQELRETDSGLHLMGGAMQPDRRERNWESRINVISIETAVDGEAASSRIEVHSACWEKALDSYSWELGPARAFFATTQLNPESLPVPDDGAVDRLRRRLANLSPSDRFLVALDVGLNFAALADLSESAIVAEMIEQAKTGNSLEGLWNEVERRHGNQERGENPFRQ
jgi:predicted MPP superfamily phosphohydrolase